MMNNEYEILENLRDQVRQKTDFVPETAVVLGSGLGNFARKIEKAAEISYSALDGLPTSTVPGHQGKFILGTLDGVPVICMQGRVHYYEGYDMEEVVRPIRLMKMLGAKRLILTNAAGCLNTDWKPGEFMMLTDQISAFVPSPLRGANIDELGTRFPDMSRIYDPKMQDALRKAAEKTGVSLREGVYLQWPGPNFETPAEIRMFHKLGADAVGMSTACEGVAAAHMDMPAAAISCLTNMAAGLGADRLSHEEVQEMADQVQDKFESLLENAIKETADL